MKIINVEKAESQLGDLMDMAQTGAVAVRERGGRITVLLPMKEYERFVRLEDMYWAELAEETFAENDWTSPEESEIALQEMLNAKD